MDIRFNLIKPIKRLPLSPKKTSSSLHAKKYSAKQEKGFLYEKIALEFLQAQGLSLLEQNLACKIGEIDLVMQDKDILVFVEVRFRKNQDYGGAISSLSPQKIHKLRRTASYFLPYLSQKYFKSIPFCRFDAICIEGVTQEKIWLKNFIPY